jgi:2-methylcitrate dehydratase PrpD
MIVWELAEMLSGITLDGMPQEVREKAVRCVQDFSGVFMGGRKFSECASLYEALSEGGDSIPTADSLALWIGSVGRLLDFDDGHRKAMGHCGVPVISAAFAVALKRSVEGRLFMEAIVRGYEAYCFVGTVINPQAYLGRGFDATGICGAIGAAVAAATILKLDTAGIANAMAIAASLCGGLNQYVIDGGAPKFLCAGWGAKLGVSAAMLAMNGLSGPKGILEGEKGFCQGFAVEYNRKLLENPTNHWEIMSVYFKRFACVRRLHASLDIVHEFLNDRGGRAESILGIDISGSRFIVDSAIYDPTDETLAQTSMPFAVALLVKYGEVTMERIKDNIGNEDINRISRMVHIDEDPAFNELLKNEKGLWGASKVTIRHDGGEFTKELKYAYGENENPFPEELVRRKFMRLSESLRDSASASEIYDELGKIPLAEDMSNIISKIVA